MIRKEFDRILERIGWYTNTPNPHRTELLKAARDAEAIAAAYQALADELREAAE